MDLSFDINQFISDFSNNCSKTQIKNFVKNEVITNYIQKRNQLCILIEGSADLVRYDSNGNRTIIEHFTKGNIFGEVFYTISTNNELFVEAQRASSVLFFRYDDIKTKCKNTCRFHSILSSSLPELTLSKVIERPTEVKGITLINY